MPYRVDLPKSVSRALERLPRAEADNISRRIVSLGNDPRPSWAQPLRGFRTWRFKVGEWRVLYDVDSAAQLVTVRFVGRRDEIYRGL